MANVGALKTKISLDSAQFQQSMAGVNRQLKGLKEETKAVTSTGTGFARGVDELRAKSDVLTRTLKLQEGQVEELKRRYEESRKATGENSKETQKARTAYNKAVASMNKTESSLKGITEELERQTNPWLKLERNLKSTGKQLQTIGGHMTSFGKNWSMSVTAPILGTGALMLKTGMDFEKSMSNVQAISGSAGDELQKLEDAAREMGAETTKSASQAADGLSYMALAGWETEEMLQGLEPILRLSEAANIDLGRASDLVTDSMSALRIEVQDLPNYLDTVSQASRKSNTSIDQLMEAFLVAGGNFAQFNVPLDEATALLGLLANRGFKGSEAGRALNAIMVNLTSGAGRAGKAMRELKISAFDTEGNFIGLEETLKLVKERTADMTEEQQAQYISMIAGKEHLKTFQGLLDGVTREYGDLKNNVSEADGALNDMAETMQDNAHGNVTRMKSAFEELSIQVSEHILPAFTNVVEKATDLAEWFGELDDETQENIITMAGLAAAIGPAAVVLGSLTTAIGGVLRVGGSLAGLLGRVGGAGLLGRIGLMGVGGPVGLAIGGLTALGAGIYAVANRTTELNEVSFEKVRQMQEEIEATDNLIERFGELQRQNKLTADEMLEYMDILDELSSTSSPDKIKELRKRQEELLEKSGLTNDEMNKFLELNDKVIEKAPTTAEAISEQGNAYANNLKALKELNEEKREEMLMIAERELGEALRNEAELLEKQSRLEKEKNNALKDRQKAHEEYISALDKVTEIENKQNDIQKEMLDLQQQGYDQNDERMQQLIEEYGLLDDNRLQEEKKLEAAKEQLDNAKQILEEKDKDLEKTNEQLKKIDDLKYEYEALLLTQADITAEKGQGIKAINDELELLDKKEKELDKQLEQGLILNDQYRENKKEIENQRDRLIEAKGELERINELAAETAYEKEIYLKTSPGIDQFNQLIASDVTKRVNLNFNAPDPGNQMLGYADGTNFHPGGSFVAGEEGYELGRFGNQWEMLNFGMYNRPSGYQVFTHDESKRILNAMKRIPGYSDGARPLGEANRVMNQLNNPSNSFGNVYVNIPVSDLEEMRTIQDFFDRIKQTARAN